MNFWQLNEKRLPKYRKDYEAFKEQDAINDQLIPVEHKLLTESQLNHPVIFVVGVPRSGTTLATQLIAKHLDVNFINNKVARFWKAPVLASGIFGLGGSVNTKSDLGRTGNIHEFGYFWRHMLLIECFDDLFKWDPRRELKPTLATLTKDKPLVMKGLYPMYHIEKMTELLENVVWVHVRRDKEDTTDSIMNARYKMYGTYGEWFSMPPSDWRKYNSPYMQVEQQYDDIEMMIEADIEIQYEQFSKDHDFATYPVYKITRNTSNASA